MIAHCLWIKWSPADFRISGKRHFHIPYGPYPKRSFNENLQCPTSRWRLLILYLRFFVLLLFANRPLPIVDSSLRMAPSDAYLSLSSFFVSSPTELVRQPAFEAIRPSPCTCRMDYVAGYGSAQTAQLRFGQAARGLELEVNPGPLRKHLVSLGSLKHPVGGEESSGSAWQPQWPAIWRSSNTGVLDSIWYSCRRQERHRSCRLQRSSCPLRTSTWWPEGMRWFRRRPP